MKTFRPLAYALLIGSLLAILTACGNKGPLVRPNQDAPAEAPATPSN